MAEFTPQKSLKCAFYITHSEIKAHHHSVSIRRTEHHMPECSFCAREVKTGSFLTKYLQSWCALLFQGGSFIQNCSKEKWLKMIAHSNKMSKWHQIKSLSCQNSSYLREISTGCSWLCNKWGQTSCTERHINSPVITHTLTEMMPFQDDQTLLVDRCSAVLSRCFTFVHRCASCFSAPNDTWTGKPNDADWQLIVCKGNTETCERTLKPKRVPLMLCSGEL